MSESSEKKVGRGEKRRQEEQKDRRSMAIYSAVGILVLAVALVILVWKSGLIQRNAAAVTIDGVKYTAADMQYYYNNVYSSYSNQYVFDSTVSVKNQQVGTEGSYTWYDVILDEANSALCRSAWLSAQAREEGFTLTEESQAQLDSFISQLNTAWITSGYPSREALIKANFGPYMTYDRLVDLVSQEYLASDYAVARIGDIAHPDSEYEDYYKEHTDELDTLTYSQFTFRASVPTTHDQGETSATVEDPTELLEALKTEQKALADEVRSKLEGGAAPEDIAEEYKDQLYSSSVSRHSTGSSVSSTSYGEWLLDSGRKAGDITTTESDYDTSVYYYVTRFEGRARDNENTHSVRHLLIQAGDGSTAPTQEQYDEAEEKAQALLDQWKAGETSEDTFAALATANSQDTGSASNGGLITGITSTSSYVEAFRDWATGSSRKEGDAELVKTEYGWHIMYYVSTDDPVWKQTVSNALQQQDYEQLAADASEGRESKQGFGMQLITP